jgi:hypothetical protein
MVAEVVKTFGRPVTYMVAEVVKTFGRPGKTASLGESRYEKWHEVTVRYA